MRSTGEQGDDDVELVIKRSSAANLKDVRLVMPLGSTLAELKARLQGLYEDRPEPACVAVRRPLLHDVWLYHISLCATLLWSDMDLRWFR